MMSRGEGALAAERAELRRVHRNGLRLLKLVNTLLDFSRLEAGRVQATYEPTDLAALTAELASSFRSAIEKAGLRLVVDCPPLPAPVYVDRDMWEKVVLNLLSNAFKFTFAGEIKVVLRPAAEGASVELRVQDTGTGIAAHELPRLFERFHRIAGARGRTHEGTGIGLALVQELVKLHGGVIAVTSELGRGSTFSVQLPFGSAHLPRERLGAALALSSTAMRTEAYVEEALRWLPEEEVAGSQYPAGSRTEGSREDKRGATSPFSDLSHSALHTPSAAPRPQPPRILLVDDNADMREYVRRLLHGPYEVTAVADGQAALACALAQPPALVLSDVMMPQLDGFSLLKALRRAPRTRTVPVVLLTARAGEEAKVEGLAEGADDYIVKPFSAWELLARVGAHIEMARLREEATRREQALRQEAEAAQAQAEHLLRQVREREQALRESEERFRHMADDAPVMIWVARADTFCTYLNQPWYDFTGQTPETGLGFGWLDAIHPDDAAGARDRFLQANARREGFRLEYRLRRRDGAYRWAIDAAAPRFEGDGEFVGYIGSVIDITDRKQAEESLQESEQRWHTLAEAMPAMVWMARPDGSLDYYNQRWYDYTGLSESQLTGWGWAAVWHPEDLPDGRARWLESLRTGQPYEYEARFRRADGNYHWQLIRAVPLHTAEGHVLRWFGTTTDIEDQKHLTIELQRINAEFQQFAYIVSHDLNEPLRTMNNFVQLLAHQAQGKLDGNAEESMAFVTDAAQRMQRMISDLLEYTRAGQTPELQTVDCEAVLAQVLIALQTQITEREAVITHDPLPTVQGDATRLGQVLQNLISNALKFCREQPRIHVSAIKENQHWKFSVRDNGIGIDPKQVSKLFQVFRRLHSHQEYSGTGIGLAICKKIVEQHGGRIWVESRPGEGSVFHFTVLER
jgi:PAS domain S-box-containing protein